MLKDYKVTAFDVIVGTIALAYLGQFVMLTFIRVPPENMTALTDGLKDMRGLFGLIVGGYIRDKAPQIGQALADLTPKGGGTASLSSTSIPAKPEDEKGKK